MDNSRFFYKVFSSTTYKNIVLDLSLMNIEQKENPSKELTIDLYSIISFCKKHYVILLILAFMLYGFYLRSYHMDFPAIGYHNMKENQYIPYTEFMYNAEEFWDYFRTETYWIGSQEHGYFTQYEFPLIPWMILVLWWIFGIKLWAARLVIILFAIGCIPLLYLVGRKLTENTFIILLSCFLFTIMPLSVFFGRNVQPEAPALFFILLGTYYFFQWREKMLVAENSRKHFFLFSICMLIAILLKVPNGIGIIPLLFFVPYKKLVSAKRVFWECIVLFTTIMFIFPLWVFFSKWVMPGAATVGTSGFTESFRAVAHNILRTLTTAYWNDYLPALVAFVLDNFTAWYFWIFLLGVFFALFTSRSLFSRFLLAWFFSLFVYIFAFADKFRGHAYYQFVFLPLVCFAAAYAVYVVGQFLHQALLSFVPSLKAPLAQVPFLFPLLVTAIVLFLSFASVTAATDRVFDTIYYGEDIAGDFIYEHSDPKDRVFIDGIFSQSVGILWHAHRYGIEEIPANLTWFQELEATLQFRWVVLYGPGINTVQSKTEVWEYIQQTYQLRQIGLVPQEDELVPYYFVLEKGAVFDLETFPVNKTPYLAKTYTNTQGAFVVYALDDFMTSFGAMSTPSGAMSTSLGDS